MPASVSKNHWPSFFTMGTGKGQKLVPTSSTHFVSDSWTIRLVALSAVVNVLNSLVAWTRSGFWRSAAAGPKMARRALPLCALVAGTSAETASSGVAKVLPVSAALVAMGTLRASASNQAALFDEHGNIVSVRSGWNISLEFSYQAEKRFCVLAWASSATSSSSASASAATAAAAAAATEAAAAAALEEPRLL